jgi:hypothetical protein
VFGRWVFFGKTKVTSTFKLEKMVSAALDKEMWFTNMHGVRARCINSGNKSSATIQTNS